MVIFESLNFTVNFLYQANLIGLLESGRYQEALHEYIPYTKGILAEKDFYDLINNAFKEYSIIYYSRDNLNNYLDFIIKNKPYFNDLFILEDTELLRKLFTTGESSTVIDNLSSLSLISEFPGKIHFDPTNYLAKYLWRMMNSINLKLVPNNIIFLKLLKQFEMQLRPVLDSILLAPDTNFYEMFRMYSEDIRLILGNLNVIDDSKQQLIKLT